MTTATPTTADAFVARLLATDDADKRRALIEHNSLSPSDARDAIQRLLNQAESLIGVDPRRMEQVCRDALALAVEAGDEFLWGMARFKQGEACAHQERNSEARGYLDEAEAVFTKLDRPVEAARTRIIWIWATANLGGDDECIRAARFARRTLRAHGEALHLATLDMNVGILHWMRGRPQLGTRCFRSALATYEALRMEERADRARQNLGLALSRLGRYQEALIVQEQAREAARRSGRTRSYALRTRAMGETHVRLGRYAAALRAFEEARQQFDSLGLHDGTTITLALDLADCYLRLNRPTDALSTLSTVNHELSQIDTPLFAFRVESRRLAAQLLLNRHEEALATIDVASRFAVSAHVEDRIWLAIHRATLLLDQSQTAGALAAAREAVAVARQSSLRPLIAEAWIAEGRALLALGDASGARRVALRARRLARAQGAAPLLQRAYELSGRIAEAQGTPRLAIRYYQDAIAQHEREQRTVIFEHRDSFAARRTSAYERLAALQLGCGMVNEALATAERAKSRALADSISGAIDLRPRGSGIVRRIARELTAAREEYAAAHAWLDTEQTRADASDIDVAQRKARISDLEARINVLLRRLQLAATPDDTTDLFGALPPPTPPVLGRGTAIVEYFFSGDDILRFVIDARGVRGERLPAVVPEIDRLLWTFRLSLETLRRLGPARIQHLAAQCREILGRFYHLLLAGIEAGESYDALVIVPHGALHYVPFHALHDGQRYLVQRYAISYAPSATLYAVCRGRMERRRPGSTLVLAHTAGDQLPYALDEAERVGTILGASVRAESGATRAVLSSEGRRAATIHIAAHGVFRPDAPLFSHVQLADGPLTTADVFNLDFRAGLVVLSACETGRSVLGGGDELVGLSRAFLHAGAASLLVSQWRVDDRSTSILMTRFYEALRDGKTPVEALCAAQRACISDATPQNDWSHPFYWAGFQLIGAA